MTRRILKSTGAEIERALQAPFPLQAGQLVPLDYLVTPVGVTTHTIIDSATTLGHTGIGLARSMLAYVEHSYAALTQGFGVETPTKLHLILAPLSQTHDGSGGAYHHSCEDPILYIDATFSATDPTDLAMALYVAEAVEVFTAVQGFGWDCSNSMGEGLSRVLAEVLHPRALGGFATAPSWIGGDRGNFIDRVMDSDTDDQANGCSVLFLFWLRKLGFNWSEICQSKGQTLAEVYTHLIGKVSAWHDFNQAVAHRWPKGTSLPTSDDAW